MHRDKEDPVDEDRILQKADEIRQKRKRHQMYQQNLRILSSVPSLIEQQLGNLRNEHDQRQQALNKIIQAKEAELSMLQHQINLAETRHAAISNPQLQETIANLYMDQCLHMFRQISGGSANASHYDPDMILQCTFCREKFADETPSSKTFDPVGHLHGKYMMTVESTKK